jgi:hypothetical protein
MALVSTDVSEELNASFIRVARIDELGTTLAVTSNRCTLSLFNFPSENDIKEVQTNIERMKLNGKHQICSMLIVIIN